jgi:hypothetical protein
MVLFLGLKINRRRCTECKLASAFHGGPMVSGLKILVRKFSLLILYLPVATLMRFASVVGSQLYSLTGPQKGDIDLLVT